MTIKKHIHRKCDDIKLRVKELINQAPGRVLVTTDAWSSRVYWE